jgi:hypothetical protein
MSAITFNQHIVGPNVSVVERGFFNCSQQSLRVLDTDCDAESAKRHALSATNKIGVCLLVVAFDAKAKFVHFAAPVWFVDVVTVVRNQTQVKHFLKIFCSA